MRLEEVGAIPPGLDKSLAPGLDESLAPTLASEEDKTELLANMEKRYAAASDPRYAAARLWMDAIIDSAETRAVIARSLACAARNPYLGEFKTGVFQT